MQSALNLPEITQPITQTVDETRNSRMRATSTLSFQQQPKVPMPKRLFLRNGSPSTLISQLSVYATPQKPAATTRKVFGQAALFKSGAELQQHR